MKYTAYTPYNHDDMDRMLDDYFNEVRLKKKNKSKKMVKKRF
jgi:hypothetical protein